MPKVPTTGAVGPWRRAAGPGSVVGMGGRPARIAVLGAGAMGTALAAHAAASGADVALLATDLDGAAVEAWRRRAPHPALQVPFHHVPCHGPDGWADVLCRAEVVFVAVSSGGLARVLAQAAPHARPEAWVLAAKGWDVETLRTPSQVAAHVLGAAPVVALAGPALAREIVVGSPTGFVCASHDPAARRCAAATLSGDTTMAFTTSDVAGVETAAAFKNVVAVAVGLAEGLAERYGQSAVVRSFGNMRAAVFARGMLDMQRLAESQGGRAPTVLGLAGAGDVYVTCQHGRNGRFGRILGGGATVEAAVASIGSTVEGVSNADASIRLAARAGIELPTARIVREGLRQNLTGERPADHLRDVFLAALAVPAAFV
jgi:glycerol-3-phosphate dehydrogenase (NAD(P)+)